jgi:hypothetical protein
MSIKTSILLASILMTCASPAAFAASAARHHSPARVHTSAPVNSQAARQAYGYAWTRRNEPTYMAVQDQLYHDSYGE